MRVYWLFFALLALPIRALATAISLSLNTPTPPRYVLVSLCAYAALFSPHGIMNFHRFDRKNNPYGDAIRPSDIPMLIVSIHARQNAP